jgi:hypothetical protein
MIVDNRKWTFGGMAHPSRFSKGARLEYLLNSKTPHACFALHKEAVTSPSSQFRLRTVVSHPPFRTATR